MMEQRADKGFTLIEIMLVVAIIGILAAMVVPRLTGRTRQAKISVTKADVNVNLPLALDLYELDMGEFPEDLEDLMENTDNTDSWRGPYLKRKPKDPWGEEYHYENPGSHNRYNYDLYSSGPDKQPGSDDDIGNWEE
jgi:general secretion pathway protein G